MNGKTKSRVDTKIEAEELKDKALGDEELENVDGGATYIKFQPIDGKVTSVTGHEGWIDVLSLNK